jgi:hypothetical protein
VDEKEEKKKREKNPVKRLHINQNIHLRIPFGVFLNAITGSEREIIAQMKINWFEFERDGRKLLGSR